MTTLEIPQNTEAQKLRIKELTEENELLFEQLHVVQEELEKYYHKLKESEQRKGPASAGDVSTVVAASPQDAEALAENQKLRALVAQQKIALRVEAQNSLESRLGQMLVAGVGSTGSLLALPGRLRKMWKAVAQTTPPAALGGKSFQKVIDAHGSGGAEAVEKLLDAVFLSPAMRANAYTALARHLMQTDVRQAAENARLAWETDPRPYRLKWLAFRVHDANDAATAEALLDMLPADMSMSESEERQAMRIRQESKQARTSKAEKDSGFKEFKDAERKRIAQLTSELESRARECEQLRNQQAELKTLFDKRTAEEGALRTREADLLKQTNAAQAEIDGLKAELNTLIDERITEEGAFQTREADLLKQANAAQAEIDYLKAELNTLIDERIAEEEAFQAREADLLKQANAAQAEIDYLKAELNTLIVERIAEEEAFQAREADLLKQTNAAQAEIDGLKAEVQNACTQLDALKAELNTLDAEHTAEKNAFRTREADLLNQANDVQAEIDCLKAELQDTCARLDALKAELNTLDAERTAEKNAFQTREADLLNQADAAQTEIDCLKAALQDTCAQLDAWKKDSEVRKAELVDLQKQKAELQTQLGKREAEVDALRISCAGLEKLVEERREDIARQHKHLEELQKLYREEFKQVTIQQKEILATMEQQATVMGGGFEKQNSNLECARKSIQSFCQQEIDNALQQTAAYSGLSSYFASGEFPAVTPWKRGWPASPDFVLWMVELIEKNDYDLIVEFGSGVTTLYTAKTIAAKENKKPSTQKTHAITFEHLEEYSLQTCSLLEQNELGGRVAVIHAPLHEYTAPDGTRYHYYSCQEKLAEISTRYKVNTSRILVIVDGPPGMTDKNARYPAFPIVMKYFASAQIDFLLDDYMRRDEKELAALWEAACATTGVHYSIIKKQLEKEALLLSIEPK